MVHSLQQFSAIEEGFAQSLADTSMFTLYSRANHLILLLYVYDIIITGDQESHIDAFIKRLNIEFAMTDLGELHYFLGIEASSIPAGLLLCQKKYALDLLNHTRLTDCKPFATPVASGTKHFIHQGEPLSDPHEYRQVVGALQYLSMTRPNNCYVVHQVCQHMHAPTTEHLKVVKHILHYIKHTIGAGISIVKGPLSYIFAYSDADWAGCPNSRQSTTGFCAYLESTLISWGSKK
ncbi:uncharacterized mitochondrial protein AtMg00810-like [Telopea speciosissima]|uniref:uncharacterized mitochondrial protein AtMg00810-like n=1 Tax=Telopea speciosissima TaxID=54955 RepID=UPI001CC3B4DB|nr:uncharacterized mitochondrial protein AtMg00810-like [Telopea speciosissima]